LATWREAIRQPVSICVLVLAALMTYLSQFVNFFHLDEEAGHNAIRQMSVAQALMAGIVIAVFSAAAVLAEEIENRTVLTLLAKPVRRWEVVLGKFAGIMLAVGAAFLVMLVVSLCTAWWTEAEAQVEKWRASPFGALSRVPQVATGQGSLAVASSHEDLATKREGKGLDHLEAAGDVLSLLTGQGAHLGGRAPLAIGGKESPSPGLASLTSDLLRFLPARAPILLQAFVLAFMQVMVVAAVAIAVSTRLPLVFTALFCSAVFVLGNASQALREELLAAEFGGGGGLFLEVLTWPVIGLCYLLPNFQNFDLATALSVGIDRVGPWVTPLGVLYGIVYTAIVLAVAVMLFRRREVA
jgi:hypothetical protein